MKIGKEMKTKKEKSKEIRRAFADKFILYDYLLQIPNNLPNEWLVYGIPEGHKCIITAFSGKTIIRDKNGYIIKKIRSWLPNGYKASKNKGKTLLQGIYYEQKSIIYLIDVIMWNDDLMIDNTAEFRLFTLYGKISEITNISTHLSTENEILFRFPTFYGCDQEGLQNAYKGKELNENSVMFLQNYYKNSGILLDLANKQELEKLMIKFGQDNTGNYYMKDGIAFIKRESLINFGYSNDYLIWKDKFCSNYFEIANMSALLKCIGKNKFLTQDLIEIEIIGTEICQVNKIYDISYEKVEMISKQNAVFYNAKVLKESTNHPLAHTISQILFKYLAKQGETINFEELLENVILQEKESDKEENDEMVS